jgi:ribonuclease G
MKKGAYLVIEHTEALHVIDVNSGNRSNKAKTQEDTALQVNLASASEVARQLRLRDMGGIIVVDFIDMADPDHRRQLYEHLKEEMSEDRAKHKILPPSKFGLVQITRQRVRPEMNIKTSEPAPTITGKEVEAPIVLIDKITGDLERLLQSGTKDKVVLHLHPFIAAYLTIGLPSIRMRWWLEHKRWVRIEPRDAYRYLEYRFKNPEGKTIY